MLSGKPTIIHVADLRCVGGVERMLIDFILSTPHVCHHLVLQGRSVHKSFLSTLISVNIVYSSKLLMYIPLPKSMRARNRVRQINSLQANSVLVWNQVVDLKGVKIPCVYYEHGSAWYEHSPAFLQKCFTQINRVIAVSYAAKRMLQLKYQINNSITVRHNVLLSQLDQSEIHFRKLPINRPIVLGSAGRLSSVKCLGLLVLAAYELKQQGFNIQVKIAGMGEEEENLRFLINKYHLNEQIELLGLIKDMGTFYQSIDIYISSSIHETCSLSCIEAMAMGLPVIGSNVDGQPEIIRHNRTGFCIPPTLDVNDFVQKASATKPSVQNIYFPLTDTVDTPKLMSPYDIAKSVVTLLESPMVYEEMSRNAILYTQKNKSFSALCQEVVDLCVG